MKTQNTAKRSKLNSYVLKLFSTHILIGFLLLSSESIAQRYLQHSFKNETLIIATDKGNYHFRPYTKQVLKVTFLPKGTDSITESHSVIQQPEIVSFNLDEQARSISLGTDFYNVRIKTKPFSINIEARGKTALSNQNIFITDSSRGFRFSYPETEILTGGGERALPIDRRGHHFKLYNQPRYGYEMGEANLNYGIPYIISSELYSVLFDNPQKGQMDFGKKSQKKWEVSFIGGELTYYFITGDSHQNIIETYTKLTGRQPMPPKWALGNLTSRMAYLSEEETRGVVKQMQEKGFPIDGIIIDLNWFGKFGSGPTQMGNLDWDRDNWPKAEDMIADFKEKNIKTILITEPYFVDSTTHYDYLKQNNLLATDKTGAPYFLTEFYFGKGGLIDIFKPEAQKWFWKQYKKHIDTGIAGWWGDLGEPEHHPRDVNHVLGKADEVHNIFGHYWEKALYDGYKEDYPDERIFNLSRSGFAGSQRYSVFPWSGDVARSWGGLQAQPSIMLSMSMSGLGYMHSDLGGFAQGEKDPELYTRWLQFGIFSPIFRPHGSGIPSEPIYWNEQTQDRVRKAIKLRYRLLPYTYTLSWENSKTGAPLTRPLWYYEPANKELYKIFDTYYWGKNLLIAPVLEKGQKERKVYLPKGTWFDFHTNKKYAGQKWITVPLTMESIPVFAKAGSFIPMTMEAAPNTEEYSLQRLFIKFFPSEEVGKLTKYTLYEDGGKLNNAYEKNKFSVFEFEAKESSTTMEISIDKNGPDFSTMPDQHMVEFIVYDQSETPSKVVINGQELHKGKSLKRFEKMYYGYFHNITSKKLHIRLIYMGVNKYNIKISK